MPILTKPDIVTKGVPAIVTLDKDLLKALPIVDADAYWKDTSNWQTIVVSFKNDEGQPEAIRMDASNPTGSFLASSTARSEFKLKSITIKDFDGGKLKIKRPELTAFELDGEFDMLYSLDVDFIETEAGFILVTESDETITVEV